nr:hypothetical protein [Candidatus Njordarchaeota archaeon]
MILINESRLIPAVERIFAKRKSKFCKVEEMAQLLVEEGLTLEEARQAISLAEDKKLVRVCYPNIDEIRGERCYELLTEEDREFDKELEEDFLKKRWL